MSAPFTMDGYTDLESVARELHEHGFSHVTDLDGMKELVACILQELLDCMDENLPFDERAAQFYSACEGIVDCARRDELL